MAFTDARRTAGIIEMISGVDRVRLHTGAPGSAGTSNQVTGNAYAHGTTAAGSWVADGAGRRENNTAVTFPDASGGDWGNVTHFSLWDGSVFFADGTLTTARNIVDGTSSIQFAAGDLGVEIPSS